MAKVAVWKQREPCLTSCQSEAAKRVAQAHLEAAKGEWVSLQREGLAELRARKAAAAERRAGLEQELPRTRGQDRVRLYESILACASEYDTYDAHAAELEEALGPDLAEPDEVAAPAPAEAPPTEVDPYQRVLIARAELRATAGRRPDCTHRSAVAMLGYPAGTQRQLAAVARKRCADAEVVQEAAPSTTTEVVAEVVCPAAARWDSAMLLAAQAHLPSPDLDTTVRQLLRFDGAERGPVHAIEGPPLSGKTVLMMQVLGTSKVQDTFTDGVVLATSRYSRREADGICGPLQALTELITGESCSFGGTQEALTSRLRALCRTRRRLLCVDAVASDQLVAALKFAVDGTLCKVLVAARRKLQWVDACVEVSPELSAAECVRLASARLPNDPVQALAALGDAVGRNPLALSIAAASAAAGNGTAAAMASFLQNAADASGANSLLRDRSAVRRHRLYAVPLVVETAVAQLPDRCRQAAAALSALQWDLPGVPVPVLEVASGMQPGTAEARAVVADLEAAGLVSVALYRGIPRALAHELVVEFLQSRFTTADRSAAHVGVLQSAPRMSSGCTAIAEYVDRHFLWHLRETGDSAGAADALTDPQVISKGRVSQADGGGGSVVGQLMRHADLEPAELPLLRHALQCVSPYEPSAALTQAFARLRASKHDSCPRLRKTLKRMLSESRPAPRAGGGVLWARALSVPDELMPAAPLKLDRLSYLQSDGAAPVCAAAHAAATQGSSGHRFVIGAQGKDGCSLSIVDSASLGEIRSVLLSVHLTGGKVARRQRATAVQVTPWNTVLAGDADGFVDEWRGGRPPATKAVDQYLFTDHVRNFVEGDKRTGPCTSIHVFPSGECVLAVAVFAVGVAEVFLASPEPRSTRRVGGFEVDSQRPVCAVLNGGALLVAAPGSCIVRALMVEEAAAEHAGGELSPRGCVVYSLPPGEGVVSCCTIPGRGPAGWSAACSLLSGPIAVFTGTVEDWTGMGPVGVPPAVVVSGHASPALSLCPTPCGSWLLSAANDGEVRLWSTLHQADADLVAEWVLPTGADVSGLVVSPQGSGRFRVAVAGAAHVRMLTLSPPPAIRADADTASAVRVFGNGLGSVVRFTGSACSAFDASDSAGAAVPMAKVELQDCETTPDSYLEWHAANIGAEAAATACPPSCDGVACAPSVPVRSPAPPPPRGAKAGPQPCQWAVRVHHRRVSVYPPREKDKPAESPVSVMCDRPVACACVSEARGKVTLTVCSHDPDTPPAFFDMLRYRPDASVNAAKA